MSAYIEIIARKRSLSLFKDSQDSFAREGPSRIYDSDVRKTKREKFISLRFNSDHARRVNEISNLRASSRIDPLETFDERATSATARTASRRNERARNSVHALPFTRSAFPEPIATGKGKRSLAHARAARFLVASDASSLRVIEAANTPRDASSASRISLLNARDFDEDRLMWVATRRFITLHGRLNVQKAAATRPAARYTPHNGLGNLDT